jgi:hypothetical protein
VFESPFDIVDPKAYSIEDSKRKTEEDRRQRDADEKKASVLKQVVHMCNSCDSCVIHPSSSR